MSSFFGYFFAVPILLFTVANVRHFLYVICVYHIKKESAMIEIKAMHTKEGIIYAPKRKKCKKSALVAARLNGFDIVQQKQGKQIKMFLLRSKKK